MITELIIFDCDGVLVDSEPLANRVFADMLNDLGLSLTLDDMFEHFVGRSMRQCMEKIETMTGQPVPPGFLSELHARTREAFEESLAPVQAVPELLASLETPFCVASSGSHDKMRLTLGITDLLPYFEGRMFSVSEVERGKPSPDIFLYAARQMGAEPARCVVVEDSPTGVAGAVAAGMAAVGYCGRTPAEKLVSAGASMTLDDMSDLVPAVSGIAMNRASRRVSGKVDKP